MTKALALASECDAVLCVGSTLSVFPAAYVPITATETGAPLLIINQGPTDLDQLAAVRVNEPAGSTLRIIANALQ